MYPFIAPDESYLIFTSRRPPTNTGGGLWISYKQPDGTWSDPRAIDLGMAAGLPQMSPDGKYLFFTAGERGKSDIYWVEAKFIEELKSAPAATSRHSCSNRNTAAEAKKPPLDRFKRTENRPAANVTTDASNPPQYYRVPEATSEGKEHMVDVGGRKLHARVFGQGSPTVVSSPASTARRRRGTHWLIPWRKRRRSSPMTGRDTARAKSATSPRTPGNPPWISTGSWKSWGCRSPIFW